MSEFLGESEYLCMPKMPVIAEKSFTGDDFKGVLNFVMEVSKETIIEAIREHEKFKK